MLIALAALLLVVFFNIGDSEKVLSIFAGFIDTQINIVAILNFLIGVLTILIRISSTALVYLLFSISLFLRLFKLLMIIRRSFSSLAM